ncbi:prolyl endopeptidase-like isoform X1 [Stegostoma tigrinum]|uniref:prolyl endopeptidase-like isoform X1 n=2 Tax=Stegostoma tigrinum TaxID=3053191 RepID=UPI00202B36B8|nr:prolyl endopeptidase-like isoform X1 [Stegostoma tigrinum]
MHRVVGTLQKMRSGVHQCRHIAAAPFGRFRTHSGTRLGSRSFFNLARNFKNLEMEKNKLSRDFIDQELLNAELKYYKSKSHKYRKLQDWFKKKLEKVCNLYVSNSYSPVIQMKDFEYFEEGGCIYRRRQNGDQIPELVLSLDQLQFLQTTEAQFQHIRVSPNQKYLASSIRTSSDESTCVVVKLVPKPEVVHVLPRTFSFEWGTDSSLFYTNLEKLHSHQALKLLLEGARTTSEMVYKENDPRFFVELASTKDGRFITINSNSKNSSEVWLLDRMSAQVNPRIVQERVPGIIYHVEHWRNQLYILTNCGATEEYRLMKTQISSPGMKSWQTVYAVKERTKLIDMELFKDHCIMILKYSDHLYLHVFSLDEPKTVKCIQLPSWACVIESEDNLKHETNKFSFRLSSPVQPPMSFLYSIEDDELYVQEDGSETTNPMDYKVTCLKAPSMDGTLIPITVFHKTTLNKMNKKPLLAHVYGAYGIDLNLDFKPEQMVLLEDGWILAYCHVRGGGELGLSWHKASRLDKKQVGVYDLEACFHHLHSMGYSNPRRTALTANSAGGVLAGSLCNVSPDSIKAVVLQAPFLDVLNTMLDPSLPLTIEEQEEWGDPLSDQNLFKCIQAYCPYHNIKPQKYPSIFITAYQDDQRVPLSGLLRYIRKLRNAVAVNAYNTTDKLPNIILDIRPGGDHFGQSNWKESIHEVARHYAFLYEELEL